MRYPKEPRPCRAGDSPRWHSRSSVRRFGSRGGIAPWPFLSFNGSNDALSSRWGCDHSLLALDRTSSLWPSPDVASAFSCALRSFGCVQFFAATACWKAHVVIFSNDFQCAEGFGVGCHGRGIYLSFFYRFCFLLLVACFLAFWCLAVNFYERTWGKRKKKSEAREARRLIGRGDVFRVVCPCFLSPRRKSHNARSPEMVSSFLRHTPYVPYDENHECGQGSILPLCTLLVVGVFFALNHNQS